MFCEESLGKIKFRTFPKRVGPRILSLESVDYFGTSEHYWVVGKKKRRIFISKTAMVGCCKLSLYLVMSMLFTFGDDWNDVPCKSLFWSLAMMNFSGIEAFEFSFIYTPVKLATTDVFPVVANTCTKSVQKQIKSIEVDKVERRKTFSGKILFRIWN